MAKPFKRVLALIAVNLAILFALLAVFEVFLRAVYVRSDQPPPGLRALYLQYQAEYEGQAIQAIPECARYDADVAYTLRPGECTFAGREFTTTVRANSAGFRDDESALATPKIVLAGDSFTMGWGVEGDETFAQLLEVELGEPVLNTGVSSFGTVRELRVLSRLELDSLRILVIQYHPNDFKENRAYRQDGDSLPIMPEGDFEVAFESDRPARSTYRFGRFLYEAQKLVTNGAIGLFKNRFRGDSHQADEFLHVLATAPIDLTDVRIIVFEINDHARNDSNFVDELSSRLGDPALPEYLRRMVVLDISDRLDEAHYLPWDGHMNRRGHAVIASTLAEAIRQLE